MQNLPQANAKFNEAYKDIILCIIRQEIMIFGFKVHMVIFIIFSKSSPREYKIAHVLQKDYNVYQEKIIFVFY